MIGLLAGAFVLLVGLAVYVAMGGFDPPPSATDDLDPCPRCGRPSKALEYHLRRCRGRMGERKVVAYRAGQQQD